MAELAEVFEIRIILQGVRPLIWRVIQVPATYSFWDLHVAIQDAMCWTDSHLHVFELVDAASGKAIQIGIPHSDGEFEILAGWDQQVRDYLADEGATGVYEYDFGDSWKHSVALEAVLPPESDTLYPVCVAGKRHCPPEDCGGARGYGELLAAITDPNHEQHDEMIEWVGGAFDPEFFDPAAVCFDDPAERKKIVRGEL